MPAYKPPHALTFHDRLSQLHPADAGRLFGPRGPELVAAGRALPTVGGVTLTAATATLRFKAVDDTGRPSDDLPPVVARLRLDPRAPLLLGGRCSACRDPGCIHVAGLTAAILDGKATLGLAAIPAPVAWGEESEERVVEAALATRAERARVAGVYVEPCDGDTPWTEYAVTSHASGRTYHVALRGDRRGASYCTCADFRTNTLGTCKHILALLLRARRRFPRGLPPEPQPPALLASIDYLGAPTLTIRAHGASAEGALGAAIRRFGADAAGVAALESTLQRLERSGVEVTVTEDLRARLEGAPLERRLAHLATEIRRDPTNHPLRTGLLRAPLLPYQLDGVAFAVGAGRAILADEVGLGKTIQAIAVAELLAREAGAQRVLVICPASLKGQWKMEIARFSGREASIVSGPTAERRRRYERAGFFAICNYEQVLRDGEALRARPWDLVIVDEAQRIKGWDGKTAIAVRGIPSRFVLALSATPLENRLEELFAILAYVDPFRLGPAFRFLHRYRIADRDRLEYRRLDEVRERIAPVLLRRTRDSVGLGLPPRRVVEVPVAMSRAQRNFHDRMVRAAMELLSASYLRETDVELLRVLLLQARRVANAGSLASREILDGSPKLDRAAELFEHLAGDPTRKILVFSEWTGMLDLVEPLLAVAGLATLRIDGSVPTRDRAERVERFQRDPALRVLTMTQAGATGLNLQAANTIVNLDIPWNPAVLEQRIGRAHRMGQTQPVDVYLLIAHDSLEHRIYSNHVVKERLAHAALEQSSTQDAVNFRTGGLSFRERLEVLLGARQEASVDEAERIAVTAATVHRQALPDATDAFLRALGPAAAAIVPQSAEARAALGEKLMGVLRGLSAQAPVLS